MTLFLCWHSSVDTVGFCALIEGIRDFPLLVWGMHHNFVSTGLPYGYRSRLVFVMSYVRNSDRILEVLPWGFSLFYLVPPSMWQDSSWIRSWLLPSRSFTYHASQPLHTIYSHFWQYHKMYTKRLCSPLSFVTIGNIMWWILFVFNKYAISLRRSRLGTVSIVTGYRLGDEGVRVRVLGKVKF
jgi:hypothetical protein